MIEKVINPKLIEFEAIKAVDWRMLIHQAAQPLIDNNDVTEHYVEGIIRSVKEYGRLLCYRTACCSSSCT